MPTDEKTAPSLWMTAHEALAIVSERNGSENAIGSIARRAYAGLLRSRAALFIREQQSTRGRKEKIEDTNADLPAAFWWAKGEAALDQDWDAGDFSTWIDRTFEWQAFGVQFQRSGIEAMLAPSAPQKSERVVRSAFEAAPPASSPLPTDEVIAAKMAELTERGWKRDAAAKEIKKEPGFEGVGNEHARRVARGNLQRGRPRKPA